MEMRTDEKKNVPESLYVLTIIEVCPNLSIYFDS